MAYKCILAMVKPDLTGRVVDSAKEVGATGATIIPASGTGAHEAKTFFGLSLDIRRMWFFFWWIMKWLNRFCPPLKRPDGLTNQAQESLLCWLLSRQPVWKVKRQNRIR